MKTNGYIQFTLILLMKQGEPITVKIEDTLSNSPLKASHYYSTVIKIEHSFGDIWRNLPTFGLIPHCTTCDGVMITPACDVAQYKTETLTYLPIIPIEDYLLGSSFMAECRGRVIELYNQIGEDFAIDWPKSGYTIPRVRELSSEVDRLNELHAKYHKKRNAIESAIAGLILAGNAETGDILGTNGGLAAALFDKGWPDKIEKIVRNSFRSDIQFMPALTSTSDSLSIWKHSVALLRYPITIPIQWLDEAQRCDAKSWSDFVSKVKNGGHLLAANFIPIKILNLNHQFRVSLLSRFASLYSRVGTEDFSTRQVTKFASEITR